MATGGEVPPFRPTTGPTVIGDVQTVIGLSPPELQPVFQALLNMTVEVSRSVDGVRAPFAEVERVLAQQATAWDANDAYHMKLQSEVDNLSSQLRAAGLVQASVPPAIAAIQREIAEIRNGILAQPSAAASASSVTPDPNFRSELDELKQKMGILESKFSELINRTLDAPPGIVGSGGSGSRLL